MTRLRLMPMLIILVTAMTALLSAGMATAAAETTFDEVNIRVQPEYDDPRVLAVIEGTLAEDVALPLTAEFLVPDSAKEPQVGMACEVPEGQGHLCKVYETKDVGGFTSLTYSVEKSRNLFFEYYWDPFTGQASAAEGKKSFKYEFKAPAAVKTLTIGVQEPVKAESFKLEPAAVTQTKDSQGLTYNMYSFSNVEKDQVITVDASYIKTDPALSSPKASPTSGAGNQAVAGALPNRSLQTILLGAVVLSIGAIVLVVRRSQSAPIAAPVARKRGDTGQQARFCSSCGNELAAGSKFCSDCGSQT